VLGVMLLLFGLFKLTQLSGYACLVLGLVIHSRGSPIIVTSCLRLLLLVANVDFIRYMTLFSWLGRLCLTAFVAGALYVILL